MKVSPIYYEARLPSTRRSSGDWPQPKSPGRVDTSGVQSIAEVHNSGCEDAENAMRAWRGDQAGKHNPVESARPSYTRLSGRNLNHLVEVQQEYN